MPGPAPKEDARPTGEGGNAPSRVSRAAKLPLALRGWHSDWYGPNDCPLLASAGLEGSELAMMILVSVKVALVGSPIGSPIGSPVGSPVHQNSRKSVAAQIRCFIIEETFK